MVIGNENLRVFFFKLKLSNFVDDSREEKHYKREGNFLTIMLVL